MEFAELSEIRVVDMLDGIDGAAPAAGELTTQVVLEEGGIAEGIGGGGEGAIQGAVGVMGAVAVGIVGGMDLPPIIVVGARDAVLGVKAGRLAPEGVILVGDNPAGGVGDRLEEPIDRDRDKIGIGKRGVDLGGNAAVCPVDGDGLAALKKGGEEGPLALQAGAGTYWFDGNAEQESLPEGEQDSSRW